MGSLVWAFIAQHPPLLRLKSRTSRETDRVKMKVVILLLCMMTIYTSQAKTYLVETATNGDYKMKLKHDDDGDYQMRKLGSKITGGNGWEMDYLTIGGRKGIVG